ncbi:MAG: redoxin domain-containing protein [Chloroflexi bacterium]|nr:redoxin domain-containing protein [Chloroflexota bacterium]
MAQLRQDYTLFVKRDAEILVVGPERPAAFKAYWEKNQFPFVGLPDPDHHVAHLYDQQVNWLKLGRMPAVVVVDKQGRVYYQHHGESMRDIPANECLLALLDELNTESQTDHAAQQPVEEP